MAGGGTTAGGAGFRERAVLWLLDQAPPEFRNHLVFRRHPAALAFAVSCYVDRALEASRRAYSGRGGRWRVNSTRPAWTKCCARWSSRA